MVTGGQARCEVVSIFASITNKLNDDCISVNIRNLGYFPKYLEVSLFCRIFASREIRHGNSVTEIP